MAIEKQVSNESQIALALISKQSSSHYKRKNHDDELRLFRSPSDSLGPPSSNCVIIIDDDDEEETLESREKKKPRLRSWWDNDDAFNELSIVVKGSTKQNHHDNEIASKVDSHFSSNDLHEIKKKDAYDHKRSSPTSTVTDEDLCVDENVGCENPTTSMKGYRHVSLEELGVSVEDLKSIPWKAFDPTWKMQDTHVSLEKLGVSVEDLKSMPWEAFDPTWEIKSATMDPWLGGYIQDMLPPP